MRVLLAAAASLAAASAAALLALADRTVDSDETGVPSPPASPPPGAGLGARAVKALLAHLGEGGSGKKKTPGYHRGPFVDAVLRGAVGGRDSLLGKAWCAAAVRWAYEAAARELGLPSPLAGLGALSSVSDWRRAAFKPYFLAAPKPGALLLLGDRHAALVAEVLGPRIVRTVEGNHFDKVACVQRELAPGDTLVDVEAFAAARRGGSRVAGLSALGAIRPSR